MNCKRLVKLLLVVSALSVLAACSLLVFPETDADDSYFVKNDSEKSIWMYILPNRDSIWDTITLGASFNKQYKFSGNAVFGEGPVLPFSAREVLLVFDSIDGRRLHFYDTNNEDSCSIINRENWVKEIAGKYYSHYTYLITTSHYNKAQ